MWSLSVRNTYLNLYTDHHRLDGTQESLSPSLGAIVAKTLSVESSVKNIKCQKKKKVLQDTIHAYALPKTL